MADISDVEAALRHLAALAAYPGGFAAPSIVGAPVLIDRGDPDMEALGQRMKAGAPYIGVGAKKLASRNTTRYQPKWVPSAAAAPAPTLGVSVSGLTVTIAGAVTAGNVVSIVSAGVFASHIALASDTPASIAAALAAELPGALSAGASVSCRLPPAATVFSTVPVQRELIREEHIVAVTTYTPTAAMRDALGAAVKVAIASTDWLTLSDQRAQIKPSRDLSTDFGEQQSVYVRETWWLIDFSTTAQQIVTRMAAGGGVFGLSPAPGDATFGPQPAAGE